MRGILLSDDGVSLRDDALYRLYATGYFPNSPRDVEQAVAIFMMEKNSFDEVGLLEYRPSQISSALSEVFLKKYARVSLCGTVSLIMCHHHMMGKKASLNSAAKIVSEFAYGVGKVQVPILSDQAEEKLRPVAIPADLADVKKHFRAFQSSAHILAAFCTIPEYVDKVSIFQTTRLETIRALQTVVYFQRMLERMDGAKRWNLIDVASALPESATDASPYLPTDEQISEILGS